MSTQPHHHPLRLARVVPTLASITAARPRRRSAFTLVELMVAVAISSIIVLTAVSCFRMVTKAIASANTLSTENGLLRSGFLLAMQDVDFWHSHADNKAPYNKQWMREPQRQDNLATDDTANNPSPTLAPNARSNDIFENTWRRPFQSVRYAPRTDTAERDPFPAAPAPVTGVARDSGYYNNPAPTPGSFPQWNDERSDDYYKDPYNRNDYVPNPNAMMAHDPRSISRMPGRNMRVPEVFVVNPYVSRHYGGYRNGSPRLALGDYALVSATDMRDPAIANETKRYPVTPAGSRAPIVTYKDFDFAVTPGVVADATPPIEIPLDNGWGMYQPLLWTSMYHRLNYFGCYQYMTPGTAILWGDRRGRTPDVSTVPLPPFTYRPRGSITPTGANWFHYVIDGDACFAMGTCDLATRMGDRFIPAPANGGRDGRTLEALSLRPCWPVVDVDGEQQYQFDHFTYRNPFVVFLGTGDFDWGTSSEQANMAANWLLGVQTVEERADITRSDQASISTTVWVPFNNTDADRDDPLGAGTAAAPTDDARADTKQLDYTGKPPQVPVMKTSIMRYGRVAGSQDLTVMRVTIDDPMAARKTELTCMPFGTSYRGARQHWRLYSPALTTSGAPAIGHRFALPNNQAIGDFYDTAAGPYYVP